MQMNSNDPDLLHRPKMSISFDPFEPNSLSPFGLSSYNAENNVQNDNSKQMHHPLESPKSVQSDPNVVIPEKQQEIIEK